MIPNSEHDLKLRNNIHLIGVRCVGIGVPTSSTEVCFRASNIRKRDAELSCPLHVGTGIDIHTEGEDVVDVSCGRKFFAFICRTILNILQFPTTDGFEGICEAVATLDDHSVT